MTERGKRDSFQTQALNVIQSGWEDPMLLTFNGNSDLDAQWKSEI